MASGKSGPRIAFYGFNRLGFDLPKACLTLKNGGEVHFLPFDDARGFEEFDGIVVPQGIFERITIKDTFNGQTTDFRVSEDDLFVRERQVQNLARDGKWICFLVGQVVDEVPAGYHTRQIVDTDLCKRILNAVGLEWISRKPYPSGLTGVTSTQNEFHEYIRQHGIARTYFELPYNNKPRILAKAGGFVVGMDYGGVVMFLPFHTTKKDEAALSMLGKVLGQGILDYRQKKMVEIPEWVQAFRFDTEKELQTELDATLKKADELQAKVQAWQDYKVVLVTSGEAFKEKVILVLEKFFGFKVDPLDEGREDAKLLDEKGVVRALIEAKGTKGGIRREHVTQTDTHRDRNDLPTTIAGVLIINCQMDVPSIEKRVATTVDDEHVKYATQNNVLIIRTTDLLLLMRHVEKSGDRKGEFLKLLAAGGGLLRVDGQGYSVIKK